MTAVRLEESGFSPRAAVTLSELPTRSFGSQNGTRPKIRSLPDLYQSENDVRVNGAVDNAEK